MEANIMRRTSRYHILEQLEKQINELGLAAILGQKMSAETAQSKRIDRSQGDSTMMVVAQQMQDLIDNCLVFHAAYINSTEVGSSFVNRDFLSTRLEPTEIQALLQLYTAGTITPLASTSLKPSGVFQGCQYVENGEPKFSRYFPGGTCVTDVKLHVITDPAQTYFVQSDATLSDGEIGIVNSYTATVSAADAGSRITGQSNYRLVGAPVGVAVEIGKTEEEIKKYNKEIEQIKKQIITRIEQE